MRLCYRKNILFLMFAATALVAINCNGGSAADSGGVTSVRYLEESPLAYYIEVNITKTGRLRYAYKSLRANCNTPQEEICWDILEGTASLSDSEIEKIFSANLPLKKGKAFEPPPGSRTYTIVFEGDRGGSKSGLYKNIDESTKRVREIIVKKTPLVDRDS